MAMIAGRVISLGSTLCRARALASKRLASELGVAGAAEDDTGTPVIYGQAWRI